ncbi:MFS transporter [Actinopolymorpha singaporensis]
MLAPYRSLLSLPGARGFVVPGLIGRFPLSMLGLGTVLVVSLETGSYTLAGSVSGTLAVATALAGPMTGSLADRWGQRRVLLPLLGIFGVATGALVAAAMTDEAPTSLLFPLAVVSGAAVPQIGSMARRRWKMLAGGSVRFDTALSLESVLDAGVFVIGPVLAAFLATSVWPGAGVVAAVTLAVLGGVLFAAQHGTEPPGRSGAATGCKRRTATPAYRVRGLWVLVAAHVMMGVCFGTTDLCVIAFAQREGHSALAGVLLATFATGSVIAGIVYGVVRWRAPVRLRFLLALMAMAAASVPLALASTIPVMAAGALLVGLAVSPALIAGTGLVELLVPTESLTEGFAWLTAAVGIGIALGSAVAGGLIDTYGPNPTLLLTTCAGLTASTIAGAGRRWLAR